MEAEKAFEDIGDFIQMDEDEKVKQKKLLSAQRKGQMPPRVAHYFEEEAQQEKPRKLKKKIVP